MRILLAPDKFKGSLTAPEVCATAQAALAEIFPDADFDIAPIADGGEGTAQVLHAALGGEWVEVEVGDPIGRPVTAGYALLPGESPTAAMEMSAASGFELVTDVPPDPLRASTMGTGQMMRDAVARGAGEILIGIGGSATNDGGTGMARALGFQFLDGGGNALTDLPARLLDCSEIVPPAGSTLPPVRVACDVTNPLLGADGATRIYGPQKGVAEDMMASLEDGLAHLADLVARDLGVDPRNVPGAGAAGGLGFGLISFCGASLQSGFELVAEATGLREKIARADLVLTGEGRIDAQTLCGKGPAGVGEMAHAAGRPVVAICGALTTDLSEVPFADQVIAVSPAGIPLEEALARGAEFIYLSLLACRPELEKLVRAGT